MNLDRVRRMSAEEIRWRAAAALRTGWQRLAVRVVPGRTREVDARWTHLADVVLARLQNGSAHFVLDPASAATLRGAIVSRWPDADEAALSAADQILAGKYDLLGYRAVQCADDSGYVDWHADAVHHRRAPRSFFADVPYLDPSIGDHKVIWELNRHQHWLRLGRAAWLTGDARYADAIVAQAESWIADNPPLVGINWASMLEIGFRAISWTWAIHCLAGVRLKPDATNESLVGSGFSRTVAAMLASLDRQLQHVEGNLSYYFSPNTHLTGEALGLYVAGTAFPELPHASRWAATGRRILLDEIDRQILPDGGHAERSTHYQRYTLDFYLLAYLTAHQPRDAEAAARFGDAAVRLAEFTRAMADDNGILPLIGDDDGGMLWPMTGRACNDVRDSLATAATLFDRADLAPWGLTEEVLWIAGPCVTTEREPIEPRPTSCALRDTGYVVLRDGNGTHAVFDVGAHGYMNGGHAHADALAVTLTIDGHPLLVDPGTATYTMDPVLRDRMRSTESHNTVTIDGRAQSIPAGPFHWRTTTDARLEAIRHNPAFDWVEAQHDGYDPITHRRSLLRTQDGGCLIVDEVLGRGPHTAAAHWHFDPHWQLSSARGRVRAMHQDGSLAWLLHEGDAAALFHGDVDGGLGWFAPAYGMREPSWSARIVSTGEAPFAAITWIGTSRIFSAPSLRRLYVECNPQTPACGAAVDDGERRALFLVRPGGAPPHGGRMCRIDEYQTDALLLHVRTDGNQLLSLSLADCRHCATPGAGSLSVSSEGVIHDLHIEIARDIVDLRASMPPATLTLRGMDRARIVRLNGRELPLSANRPPDSLLIHGSQWRDASPQTAVSHAIASTGAAFAQR